MNKNILPLVMLIAVVLQAN